MLLDMGYTHYFVHVSKLINRGTAQVGGELANPNGTDDVGVRKLTANLDQAGILA